LDIRNRHFLEKTVRLSELDPNPERRGQVEGHRLARRDIQGVLRPRDDRSVGEGRLERNSGFRLPNAVPTNLKALVFGVEERLQIVLGDGHRGAASIQHRVRGPGIGRGLEKNPPLVGGPV
jgi:hypothetical protein